MRCGMWRSPMTRTRTIAEREWGDVEDNGERGVWAAHPRRRADARPLGLCCGSTWLPERHGRLCNLERSWHLRAEPPRPPRTRLAGAPSAARSAVRPCSEPWPTVLQRSARRSSASMTHASMHGSKAIWSLPSRPRRPRNSGPSSPRRRPQSSSGRAVSFGRTTKLVSRSVLL